MKHSLLLLLAAFCLVGSSFSCAGEQNKNNVSAGRKPATARADTLAQQQNDTAVQTLAGRQTVPVLCYHQIRDWTPKDSKFAMTYIVPPAAFDAQMKTLHDSGYHTILPDDLLANLQTGKALPPKPVLLTFDDGPESQIANAIPELKKYGFKATYFIMTVSLNRPNFVTTDQVKSLADDGNVIGCHTWDHHMVTKYTVADWPTQLVKPTATLEKITGKPVVYFAYPDGVWNEAAAEMVKANGYKAAFQLWSRADAKDSFFTIKRRIVDGHVTGPKLVALLNSYGGAAIAKK